MTSFFVFVFLKLPFIFDGLYLEETVAEILRFSLEWRMGFAWQVGYV